MNHRTAKRAIARLFRFARPCYSPALSQKLQGRNVMDGALKRGRLHRRKYGPLRIEEILAQMKAALEQMKEGMKAFRWPV